MCVYMSYTVRHLHILYSYVRRWHPHASWLAVVGIPMSGGVSVSLLSLLRHSSNTVSKERACVGARNEMRETDDPTFMCVWHLPSSRDTLRISPLCFLQLQCSSPVCLYDCLTVCLLFCLSFHLRLPVWLTYRLAQSKDDQIWQPPWAPPVA